MSPDQSFNAFQNFIATNTHLQSLLRLLSPGSEIAILIGDRLDLTLRDQVLLNRPALAPALRLHLTPRAVEALTEKPVISLPDLAQTIFQEAMLGNIWIERVASWWQLTRQGYLRAWQVIRAGL